MKRKGISNYVFSCSLIEVSYKIYNIMSITYNLYYQKLLVLCTLLFCLNCVWCSEIKVGDIIYQSDFSEKGRKLWSITPSARWENNASSINGCLLVNDEGMIHTSLDLSPYRGMKLLFLCKAKAENVTKPSASYLGAKYMFHCKTKSNEVWKNQDNVYGTFDWKEIGFYAIIPEDSNQGDLFLGLQGSTGKVWFDSIIVKVADLPVQVRKSKHNSLASTHFRGTMSPIQLNENDMETLGKEWKANLIRWQLNMTYLESQAIGSNLNKYDQWINAKLLQLDSTLVLCAKYGVKLVIDLHSLPGGSEESIPRMFMNKEDNDYFVSLWERIARRYRGNKSVWGYDLMNEPIQSYSSINNMGYVETQYKTSKAIREIDKKTPIIFEVGEADSPSEFTFLKPLPINNIVYEVHMYVPGTFTHQGVNDNKTGITYPGIISGSYYNKNTLREILHPVRDFQLTYNVPIFVGEFSAIRWAPGAAQYLDDCISIFEEYGWNWTYHAFREWNGWDVEFENGTNKSDTLIRAIQDTDRKKVLLKWFGKNQK
jgi:endoglucanase